MFAGSYFAPTYFAPTYWPPTVDEVIPFDPTNVGSGGSPLSDVDQVAALKRIWADDERVLMQVIKRFLEMQRDA
jgi:hypothetical protein